MLSIQELRKSLNQSPDLESKLPSIVKQLSELFDNATGIYYSEGEHTIEYRLVEEQTALSLVTRPVTEVVKVEVSEDGFDWTELESSQYRIANNYILRLKSSNYSVIRVATKSGYTETTCPALIKQALITQAKFSLARNGEGAIAIQSQSFEGGAGVYLKPDIHPFFQKVVDKYKRMYS